MCAFWVLKKLVKNGGSFIDKQFELISNEIFFFILQFVAVFRLKPKLNQIVNTSNMYVYKSKCMKCRLKRFFLFRI